MKRFYKTVSVDEPGEGYGVLLDGKPVRTPAARRLLLPTRALAEAIAEEWAAQEETIRPAEMPLVRLASTAIDRIEGARAGVIAELVRYGGTDLLCYRAGEPTDLAERQLLLWQPWLDWATERFGVTLTVTIGVTPVDQPSESLQRLESAIVDLEAFPLTAVADLTAALGSLVLALAVLHAKLSGEEAAAAALVDHEFQAERWGEDREEMRRLRLLRRDILAGARFLALLDTETGSA